MEKGVGFFKQRESGVRLKLNLENAVFIWLAAVLFFPYFPKLFPGYLGSNLAFVFSVTLPLAYFMYFGIGVGKCIFYCSLLIVFYFFASLLVASFHDARMGGFSSELDLLVELIRPLVIFVVFLFWVSFLKKMHQYDLWCANVYLFFALVVSVLCYLEVYGGADFKNLMYFLYKRDYKEIIADKATGVFGITYYLSFFILFPFIYALVGFLVSFRAKFLLFALVLMGAAFISQSRTGFFAYLLASFVSVVAVALLSGRRGFVVAALCAPLLLAGTGYFYMNMETLLQNFTYLNAGLRFVLEGHLDLSGQSGGSANVRIAQFHYALDNMKWLGFVGSGMAKDGSILMESVYALYLYRYGLIGLSIFFFILVACVFSSLKKIKMARMADDKERVSLYIALVCYFCVVPLALFSSAMQDAPKLSVFYYCLVAVSLISEPVFHESRIK